MGVTFPPLNFSNPLLIFEIISPTVKSDPIKFLEICLPPQKTRHVASKICMYDNVLTMVSFNKSIWGRGRSQAHPCQTLNFWRKSYQRWSTEMVGKKCPFRPKFINVRRFSKLSNKPETYNVG